MHGGDVAPLSGRDHGNRAHNAESTDGLTPLLFRWDRRLICRFFARSISFTLVWLRLCIRNTWGSNVIEAGVRQADRELHTESNR
jgi:hypothetical protein